MKKMILISAVCAVICASATGCASGDQSGSTTASTATSTTTTAATTVSETAAPAESKPEVTEKAAETVPSYAAHDFLFDGNTVSVKTDLSGGWSVEFGENATYLFDCPLSDSTEAAAYGTYTNKEEHDSIIAEYSGYDSYKEADGVISFKEDSSATKYVLDLGNDAYYMISVSRSDKNDPEKVFARFDVKLTEAAEAESGLKVTYDGSYTYKGKALKTVSDILEVETEYPIRGVFENVYICGFDTEEGSVRALAYMPDDLAEKYNELDILDENYEQDSAELVKDLQIAQLDDLKADIPSQKELDKLIGKKGKELLEDGYAYSGWSVTEEATQYWLTKGNYEFTIIPEEDYSDKAEDESIDWEELLKETTVKSVKYNGLSTGVYDIEDIIH